jgi:hypothetical protein
MIEGQLRPQRQADAHLQPDRPIATGPPPANQRYLVQFTVTGYADKARDEAPDIEAIIAGSTSPRSRSCAAARVAFMTG